MPGLGVAAVLAGSVFWARRVGWLQADAYWYAHHRLLDWFNTQADRNAAYEAIMRFNNSLHESSGWLLLAKIPKEVVALSLLLIAATQLSRVRQPRAFALAYIGLFLLASGSALTALVGGRWIEVIAGCRNFVGWVLGATATPLASTTVMRSLGRACAWTLLIQAVLVAIEMQHGLLIYSMFLFDHDWVRAVGTFNLPVSLGTFAVVTLAIAWCWGELPRRAMVVLTVLTLAILVVTASGAAWFAFTAAVMAGVLRVAALRKRILLLVCSLPLALLTWFALPHITGRWDIHDSLWGRIYPVQAYAEAHLSASEIAFGSGFGRGTNALSAAGDQPTAPVAPGTAQVGDSLPAVLFWQVGLIGLTLAYGLMFLALRVDPKSRPVGVAIIVSSIAVNVTELFPVNIVLGFWLAHAARVRDSDDDRA